MPAILSALALVTSGVRMGNHPDSDSATIVVGTTGPKRRSRLEFNLEASYNERPTPPSQDGVDKLAPTLDHFLVLFATPDTP